MNALAPAPYGTAGNCNLWSGGIHVFVAALWLLLGGTLVSTVLGIALAGIGLSQIQVSTGMRAGTPTRFAKATLIAGIVGSVISLNPINAVIAGFGYLQLGQPEVVAWLDD